MILAACRILSMTMSMRISFIVCLLACTSASKSFAQAPELDYKYDGTKTYIYEGMYERGDSSSGTREKFTIKMTPYPANFDAKEIISESAREILNYDQKGVLPTASEPIYGCLSWPVDYAGANYSDDKKTSHKWGQLKTRALVFQPDIILAFRVNTRNQKKWAFQRHVQRLPTGNPNETEKKRSGIFSMVETIECEFESIQRNLANIKFKYDLRSREAVEGNTVEAAYGTGTYVFDLGAGLIQSFRFSGHHLTNYEDARGSANLKIAMNFLKMEDAEYLKAQTMSKGKKPISRSDMSGHAYMQAIERIASSNARERRDAVLAFYRYDANLSKAEGGEALQAAFDKLDSNEKFWCASAMGRWSNDKTFAFLKTLLEDKDLNVRLGAIDGLLQLTHPNAQSTACALLADKEVAAAVFQHLVIVGSAAEPGVITVLSHPEKEVKLRACKLLALIGTKKCLARLELLKADREKTLASEAETAIAKIKERDAVD